MGISDGVTWARLHVELWGQNDVLVAMHGALGTAGGGQGPVLALWDRGKVGAEGWQER